MAILTPRENEILTLSWECFKNDPQVSYTKLAAAAGLKGAPSATTAYLAAKKKMLANGTAKLTPREREILALAWKCFDKAPTINYAKLAELAELKNAASATTAFYNARKKMLASAGSGVGGTDGDESPAPTKKKIRKILPSARNRDAAAEDAAPPPAKKTKLSKASAIKLEEEDEDEESGSPPPAQKRKSAKASTRKAKDDAEGSASPTLAKKTKASALKVEDEAEELAPLPPRRAKKPKKVLLGARAQDEAAEESAAAAAPATKRKRVDSAAEPSLKSTVDGSEDADVKSESEDDNVDVGLVQAAKEFLQDEGKGKQKD